jgi:hypothetical protein
VRFTEDVAVRAGDLALLGTTTVPGPVTGFEYDPVTRTATWTFGRAFVPDRIRLVLSGGVADRVGNHPPGDATFPFRSTAGDVTGDGRVTALDLLHLRTRIARGATAAGSVLYTPYDDLDGDGRISALDIVTLRRLMA